MKYLKQSFPILIILLFTGVIYGQDVYQWRGEHRDGVFKETGLLKSWPYEGPELLWFNDSLLTGYSSPVFDEKAIYLTGLLDTMDCLMALDYSGNVLWQTAYGKAWTESFSDSRATPTIDGDYIYVSSGYLDAACLNKHTGELVWHLNTFDKYEGKSGVWGFSESLLVADDKVFITPAGHKTTMVALDKKTGEKIWTSPTLNDTAGFVSPILVQENNKNIIINVLANNVVGINASSGEIMFSHNYSEIDDDRAYALWSSSGASRINTNTPIYNDGEIYVTSGYNHSGVKYKLADDLSSLSVVWVDSVLDVHHGHTVLVDGYLYGSNWINNGNGNWCSINWETGEAGYETKWQNKGSIIYADSMLYCYEEKRGHVALVKPNPEAFEVVSYFRVTKGRGPHWTHPVIHDGKLYIRHGKALMVYNIKA